MVCTLSKTLIESEAGGTQDVGKAVEVTLTFSQDQTRMTTKI